MIEEQMLLELRKDLYPKWFAGIEAGSHEEYLGEAPRKYRRNCFTKVDWIVHRSSDRLENFPTTQIWNSAATLEEISLVALAASAL
jgi:hypothetical protein